MAMSASCDRANVSPRCNSLTAPNVAFSVSSDNIQLGIRPKLQAEGQYGQVGIRDSKKFPQQITVNELANFIMSEDFIATQPDLNWLEGLRHGSHLVTERGHTALDTATAALPPPSSWPEIPASGNGDIPNEHLRVLSSSLSGTSVTSTSLDETALALATGMPIRYGPHMARCLDLYFCYLYPTLPIIHETRFRHRRRCNCFRQRGEDWLKDHNRCKYELADNKLDFKLTITA
jgi:hypothetical protein